MASQHDRMAADPPRHLTVQDGFAVLWKGAVVIGALLATLRCAGVAG